MKSLSALMVLLFSALALGCGREDPLSPPILVATDPDAEINAWPLGLTRGRVVIDENCIKLDRSPAQPDMVTLVFPPDYRLRKSRKGWDIITSRADTWGVVGAEREIGGGSLTDDSVVSHYVSAELKGQCLGPYWLVTPEDPVELQPRNIQPSPPSTDS